MSALDQHNRTSQTTKDDQHRNILNTWPTFIAYFIVLSIAILI